MPPNLTIHLSICSNISSVFHITWSVFHPTLHLSVRLFFCLSVCLFFRPSVLFVCKSVHLFNVINCPFICPLIHPSLHMYVCLPVCLTDCPSILAFSHFSFRLFVWQSICLSVWLPVFPSVNAFICVSLCPLVCLSVFPSVHLFIYLSVRLSACQFKVTLLIGGKQCLCNQAAFFKSLSSISRKFHRVLSLWLKYFKTQKLSTWLTDFNLSQLIL